MKEVKAIIRPFLLSKVVTTIQQHTRTGNPGDGKISVITVEEVVKIRTGQRGEKA